MTATTSPSTRLTVLIATCLSLTLLALPPIGGAAEIEVDIEIAPSTINLAFGGDVVTVHTDIPYNDVDGSSVVLYYRDQGVAISSWKSDDRGYFVAKFLAANIRTLDDLRIPGSNLFELWGVTWSGNAFLGSDSVRVIFMAPRRGPKTEQPSTPADR